MSPLSWAAWRGTPAAVPAVLGGLALLAAAGLAGVAVPRWQAETAQALQQARAAQAGARRLQAAEAAAQRLPAAAPAQRLVQALPGPSQLPQRVAALVLAAQRHGVQIDQLRQAQRQPLGNGPAALAAQQVPLRLTGSGPYAGWRQWVAEALQADDALLLDTLRLGRPGTDTPLLAGELQWVLLQRSDDAAAAAPAAPAASGGAVAPAPVARPLP